MLAYGKWQVIDEIGTDPLRFTLVTGNTAGQDLNLSMERLRSNRNFINKLWNGGKFILFNLKEAPKEELHALCNVTFTRAEIDALPLAERWVVSKAHKLVNQVCVRPWAFGFVLLCPLQPPTCGPPNHQKRILAHTSALQNLLTK